MANAETTLNRSDTMKNTAIFTMGLPAAGKSTLCNARYGSTHTTLDPDAVKESHPDYDPKDPRALHAWSQEIVEAQFAEMLAAGEGNWVIDGTGTNAEKMVRRMNAAKAAGYEIHLVYVVCSLATSLLRNSLRDRVVPEDVVRAKALDVATAFELIAPHADVVEAVDNN
jgi:predicted kinase